MTAVLAIILIPLGLRQTDLAYNAFDLVAGYKDGVIKAMITL